MKPFQLAVKVGLKEGEKPIEGEVEFLARRDLIFAPSPIRSRGLAVGSGSQQSLVDRTRRSHQQFP
jgi:hypothetical protein